MVTIVKHEWHQVDSQFAYELDEDKLSEIYPDLDEDQISELLVQIETGYKDIEEVISDAWENDVEIEWDRQYDDWWTDRKGGYEVTYELGDESSWTEPDKPAEPHYQCTKCRWKGGKYETLTQHLRQDGTVIENYYDSDEDSDNSKEVCPMCDSDVALTEHGKAQEEEQQRLMEELSRMALEDEDES